MKVLVIGSGGREHAIVDTLARSPGVTQIFCAPGNPGIASQAQLVSIPADDLEGLLRFVKENHVDLTMVGPEAPLVAGIVDLFRAAGLAIVGPSKAAARLEGSKSFAKDFMNRYGIPTARCELVTDLKAAETLDAWPERSVVKADGLAAGKGVKVCTTREEAREFLRDVMGKRVFGEAGSTVVVEECLDGDEATVMAFCDGKTLSLMPASQDHKRLLDGDAGPNTGGMGAYAPAPCVTDAVRAEIEQRICQPFLRGIQAEGFDFRGIIYFGLMLTSSGPKVLEFNVRLGDPETQVVLPLLESDFSQVLHAVALQRLGSLQVTWKKQSAVCIVLASQGYPGAFEKGKVIRGLGDAGQDARVYHAGTSASGSQILTAGGRVLGVTASADVFERARDRAYQAVSKIQFDGITYRKDIGARAIAAAKVSR
jgi:phosphoribosylamine--glycine ligase